jgi:hypothetical protein
LFGLELSLAEPEGFLGAVGRRIVRGVDELSGLQISCDISNFGRAELERLADDLADVAVAPWPGIRDAISTYLAQDERTQQ